MAISILQSNKGFIGNSAGPLSVAYSSNNASGNLLVASFFANNLSGVSDSQGNTWTQLFASTYSVSGVNQYIYYCLSSKSGANTVTLTFSGGGSYSALVILEASGGTWSVDGTATGASGSGTSFSSGSMTTTGTNDLLISGTYNSSDLAVTAGTGWTTLQTGSNYNDTLQYQIVTSAGSYTSTASTATSTSGYMIDIGAFTASGGGGSINPSLSGNINVTGTVSPQFAVMPALSGFIGVTGSVNPTFSQVNPSLSGTISVTGFVNPTLFNPAAAVSGIVAHHTGEGLVMPQGLVVIYGSSGIAAE